MKPDFIKPTLRLPLTALLPICPERTHASHKCLDFCDFIAQPEASEYQDS